MIESRSHFTRVAAHAFRDGVEQPERWLAIGVIARWADDLGTRYASPIDESWADLAGVPMDWLERLDADGRDCRAR